MVDAHDIAIVCHEANRAYCSTMGDVSQQPWDLAPMWQKDSAIKGVEGVLSGKINTPEESHASWCEEKKATGWKYGPIKRPLLKEHPCLVSYDQLPFEQRIKDALFFGIIKALASQV